MSTKAATTASGPVTGPGAVTMRYGELVLQFRSGDGSARFRLPPEYEEFRVADDEPSAARIDWRLGDVVIPPRAPDLPGTIWDFWRMPDGADLMVFYRGDERIPYATMWIDASLETVRIAQDPAALGSDMADVGMYPISEIMASRLLSRLDAVDLHASTAVLDGRAYVFLGHSGAGKTTISELALQQGATILSDDRTIVGVRNGVPIAWGTPWHGTGRRSSSRTAPIAAIFLLRQATSERAERLPPTRALKEMYVRLIHQRLTASESEAALATVGTLAAAARMWELHFRPVPEAIAVAIDAARER